MLGFRFLHITWPLLLPYTYTVVLLTTMGTLRIFDMSLFTVQLAIGNFSNFYTTDESLLFAGLALAMMPPLVVFAVLQRSFTEGLTVGALRD